MFYVNDSFLFRGPHAYKDVSCCLQKKLFQTTSRHRHAFRKHVNARRPSQRSILHWYKPSTNHVVLQCSAFFCVEYTSANQPVLSITCAAGPCLPSVTFVDTCTLLHFVDNKVKARRNRQEEEAVGVLAN